MPNDIEKIGSLKIHMIIGLIITVITLIRMVIVAKAKDLEPLKVSTGRQKIITWNHRLIYVLLVVVGVSGIVFSQGAGVGDIVFFGVEAELYASVESYGEIAEIVHKIATKVLMFLIAMHLVGIISYAMKSKDGVLKRMWF